MQLRKIPCKSHKCNMTWSYSGESIMSLDQRNLGENKSDFIFFRTTALWFLIFHVSATALCGQEEAEKLMDRLKLLTSIIYFMCKNVLLIVPKLLFPIRRAQRIIQQNHLNVVGNFDIFKRRQLWYQLKSQWKNLL